MKRKQVQPVQLTVRGVPSGVKKQLVMRAAREHKSLNNVLVEILTNAAGTEPSNMIYRNLSELAGTWVADAAFDSAIEAQDQIDESLWQ
jgi:plasmid stability protein